MRATRIVVSAALMLIVTAANGASQSPAGPDGPAPVPPRLHSGEAVWVTTSGGDELAGTVRSASLLTLELTTTGVERSIEWKDIVLVEVRDSVWNGTRNGALIGAAAGGTFAGPSPGDSDVRPTAALATAPPATRSKASLWVRQWAPAEARSRDGLSTRLSGDGTSGTDGSRRTGTRRSYLPSRERGQRFT
jgi:hypothetical protein